MIKHLVFLRYASDTGQDVKDAIIRDLGALQGEIDGILAFGHGPNLSPEVPVVHGFLDMFWFDFKEISAREAYLENETHKAIGSRINAAAEGGIAGVFVCDIQV